MKQNGPASFALLTHYRNVNAQDPSVELGRNSSTAGGYIESKSAASRVIKREIVYSTLSPSQGFKENGNKINK